MRFCPESTRYTPFVRITSVVTGLIALMATVFPAAGYAQPNLYRNSSFTLSSEAVRQGTFTATARSPYHLVSDYYPETDQIQRTLIFRFSVVGPATGPVADISRTLYLPDSIDAFTSPQYVFGQPDTTAQPARLLPDAVLKTSLRVSFRVDMRPVLEAFSKQGYFEWPGGYQLKPEEFKNIVITGNVPPLRSSFADESDQTRFRLTDPDRDGIYELTLLFNAPPPDGQTAREWTLSRDISAFPRYESGRVLLDALYNLSLEEMLTNIRPDSTFSAGANQEGITTWGISYSTVLSLAAIAPDIARNSLLKKVRNNQIIQDTGTGGSWPVSSDRVTWALAAWEVYASTGDKQWLQTAYDIIKNTVETDEQAIFDPDRYLFYGESTFLNAREQSYPQWMSPKDIYESRCLGTNAVYYQTYRILATMARELNDSNPLYELMAEAVKKAINQYLWQADRQYYGQYLYGGLYPALSPRSETLGASLCILFDIAGPNQQKAISQYVPSVDYGTPAFFPQSPGIASYHNNAVWPFVQSYWAWAAAKTGNTKAVEHSLAAIYRQAALFLTNKQNFVASTGSFAGTETNADRQLESAAGNLATVYRVLFGMQFQPDKLTFKPFVPAAYAGTKTLHDFQYRNASLTIVLQGHGNTIRSVTLDGRRIPSASVPAELKGKHRLVITLANNRPQPLSAQFTRNHYALQTPVAQLSAGNLRWEAIPDASQYVIFRNGKQMNSTAAFTCPLPDDSVYTEYQVLARDENGRESFLSEPVVHMAAARILIGQAETIRGETRYAGYEGKGYMRISTQSNLILPLTVTVPEAGTYLADFRYANGNGPVDADDKCAIRTLALYNKDIGTIVLPQRGVNAWSDWGFTNALPVQLPAGVHTFTLVFRRTNANMHTAVNEALIDYIRLRKLE